MTLDFSASVNRPKINAIEIVPAPASAARQEEELEAGVSKELTLEGAALPSGVYLVKATSPARVSHLKLVLTK